MILEELNKIYGHMSILDVLQRLYNYERRCKAAEEVIKYIGNNYFEFPLTKICYEAWQKLVKEMEEKK